VLVLALGLMGPIGALAFAVVTSTPASHLVRDPTAVFDSGPHIGVLSTIGVALWSAAATVCLFASWAAKDESRRFLLWSGLISLLLMLDDALMLHEFVGPYILHRAASLVETSSIALTLLVEIAFYLTYFLVLAAYLGRFVRYILRTDYVYLGAALMAFTTSVLMDVAVDVAGSNFLTDWEIRHLLEDGVKFLGIVLWLSYFVVTAAASLGHRN
jgi:hypothetical protein